MHFGYWTAREKHAEETANKLPSQSPQNFRQGTGKKVKGAAVSVFSLDTSVRVHVLLESMWPRRKIPSIDTGTDELLSLYAS